MAKNESDIFICKLKKDDYWTYPSPFVAHGGGTEIQFRNLTDEPLEIDLQGMPVHPQKLALPAGGADFVIVNGNAEAGFYLYEADMLLPAAPRGQAATRSAAAKAVRRKAVKGGSSPKIIIDT